MKSIISFTYLSYIILSSCSNSPHTINKDIAVAVDSFNVSGLDIGQQLYDLSYINDTVLRSYDLVNKNLVFLKKDKYGDFQASVKKAIDTEFWSIMFSDSLNCYFQQRDHSIQVYNKDGETKTDTKYINYQFKFLKDEFALESSRNSPVLKIGDTLISVIVPTTDEGEKSYFKENEIAEFVMNKNSDTLRFLTSYITKPVNLSDFDYPYGHYCLKNNKIFLIYPAIDTLYVHDRSTRNTSKLHIKNDDYHIPNKFSCKSFAPDYGSCQTKYYLNNFRYDGIRFNPITKHFILFYYVPAEKPKSNSLPTPNDQHLKALIMNEELKVVNHVILDKIHSSSMCFFFIPEKGFAMPLKGNEFIKNKYLIYNL